MSNTQTQGGKMTVHEQMEQRTLALLRELGKARVTEDAIKRGKHFQLPETMSVRDAIKFLVDYERAHEKINRYSRTFMYRPWDVAVAFERATKVLTGAGGIGRSTFSMFGETPPERRVVKIGPGANDTIEVPWGQIEIPMLQAVVYTSGQKHPELGTLGTIVIDAPKKFGPEIEGLFALIDKLLDTDSIYRSKAITAADDPDFLDLSTLDPSKIIYSNQVNADLDAHVLTVIEHPDVVRSLGESTKRAVLMEGPYGTGKTSALMIVAQRAVAANWTVIHVRPGKDNPFEALQTARLYADEQRGALVLIEDVDTFSSDSDPAAVTKLLDAFDGIEAKGAPMIALLTTNHPELIHKGMLRPGRLDAVIHVGDLDGPGILRLIQATVPEDKLAPTLCDSEFAGDSAAILGEHGDGMPPAFVREGIGRAVRYAIAKANGKTPEVLTLDDFTNALDSLRPQLQLMHDAEEGKKPEPLAVALHRTVRDAVQNSGLVLSESAYHNRRDDREDPASKHSGFAVAQEAPTDSVDASL